MKIPDLEQERVLFDEIICNHQTEKFDEFCKTFGEWMKDDDGANNVFPMSISLLNQTLNNLLRVSLPQEKANLMLQSFLDTIVDKISSRISGYDISTIELYFMATVGEPLIGKALSIGNQQAAIMLHQAGAVLETDMKPGWHARKQAEKNEQHEFLSYLNPMVKSASKVGPSDDNSSSSGQKPDDTADAESKKPKKPSR